MSFRIRVITRRDETKEYIPEVGSFFLWTSIVERGDNSFMKSVFFPTKLYSEVFSHQSCSSETNAREVICAYEKYLNYIHGREICKMNHMKVS